MKNILHIISSAREDLSYSKGLSSAIVEKISQQNNIRQITVRDLVKDMPPLANEIDWMKLWN
ncbi:NAD(P)H-dependent oxidoreductase [Chryseobacterium sp. WLY505]|uniref:NAD(P)H-dependent oxidoreductase n=1 Tax=Chryseobacterium sp. WLY505 TaxID=3068892 RepID=UPI002796802A|nr:NAD(P)H-dependent oxidoreductase [Chryseobacterium sp. WLY505]MDQ1858943.1 NAD(P)H-dependent oxidoreductase [Chryseobacterium sp. WLY505]